MSTPPLTNLYEPRSSMGPAVTATVDDLTSDLLVPIINKYWPNAVQHLSFPLENLYEIISTVYYTELLNADPSNPSLQILDLTQYLEKFVWPLYNPYTSSYAHVMTLIALINTRLYTTPQIDIWDLLLTTPSSPLVFKPVDVGGGVGDQGVPLKNEFKVQELLRVVPLLENTFSKLPHYLSLIPSSHDKNNTTNARDNSGTMGESHEYPQKQHSEKLPSVLYGLATSRPLPTTPIKPILPLHSTILPQERLHIINFLNLGFTSLENPTVRKILLNFISLAVLRFVAPQFVPLLAKSLCGTLNDDGIVAYSDSFEGIIDELGLKSTFNQINQSIFPTKKAKKNAENERKEKEHFEKILQNCKELSNFDEKDLQHIKSVYNDKYLAPTVILPFLILRTINTFRYLGEYTPAPYNNEKALQKKKKFDHGVLKKISKENEKKSKKSKNGSKSDQNVTKTSMKDGESSSSDRSDSSDSNSSGFDDDTTDSDDDIDNKKIKSMTTNDENASTNTTQNAENSPNNSQNGSISSPNAIKPTPTEYPITVELTDDIGVDYNTKYGGLLALAVRRGFIERKHKTTRKTTSTFIDLLAKKSIAAVMMGGAVGAGNQQNSIEMDQNGSKNDQNGLNPSKSTPNTLTKPFQNNNYLETAAYPTVMTSIGQDVAYLKGCLYFSASALVSFKIPSTLLYHRLLLHICERSLILFIGILSTVDSRRMVQPLFKSFHFVEQCLHMPFLYQISKKIENSEQNYENSQNNTQMVVSDDISNGNTQISGGSIHGANCDNITSDGENNKNDFIFSFKPGFNLTISSLPEAKVLFTSLETYLTQFKDTNDTGSDAKTGKSKPKMTQNSHSAPFGLFGTNPLFTLQALFNSQTPQTLSNLRQAISSWLFEQHVRQSDVGAAQNDQNGTGNGENGPKTAQTAQTAQNGPHSPKMTSPKALFSTPLLTSTPHASSNLITPHLSYQLLSRIQYYIDFNVHLKNPEPKSELEYRKNYEKQLKQVHMAIHSVLKSHIFAMQRVRINPYDIEYDKHGNEINNSSVNTGDVTLGSLEPEFSALLKELGGEIFHTPNNHKEKPSRSLELDSLKKLLKNPLVSIPMLESLIESLGLFVCYPLTQAMVFAPQYRSYLLSIVFSFLSPPQNIIIPTINLPLYPTTYPIAKYDDNNHRDQLLQLTHASSSSSLPMARLQYLTLQDQLFTYYYLHREEAAFGVIAWLYNVMVQGLVPVLRFDDKKRLFFDRNINLGDIFMLQSTIQTKKINVPAYQNGVSGNGRDFKNNGEGNNNHQSGKNNFFNTNNNNNNFNKTPNFTQSPTQYQQSFINYSCDQVRDLHLGLKYTTFDHDNDFCYVFPQDPIQTVTTIISDTTSTQNGPKGHNNTQNGQNHPQNVKKTNFSSFSQSTSALTAKIPLDPLPRYSNERSVKMVKIDQNGVFLRINVDFSSLSPQKQKLWAEISTGTILYLSSLVGTPVLNSGPTAAPIDVANIVMMRGCEVVEVYNEKNEIVKPFHLFQREYVQNWQKTNQDLTSLGRRPTGRRKTDQVLRQQYLESITTRSFYVKLDINQHKKDMMWFSNRKTSTSPRQLAQNIVNNQDSFGQTPLLPGYDVYYGSTMLPVSSNRLIPPGTIKNNHVEDKIFYSLFNIVATLGPDRSQFKSLLSAIRNSLISYNSPQYGIVKSIPKWILHPLLGYKISSSHPSSFASFFKENGARILASEAGLGANGEEYGGREMVLRAQGQKPEFSRFSTTFHSLSHLKRCVPEAVRVLSHLERGSGDFNRNRYRDEVGNAMGDCDDQNQSRNDQNGPFRGQNDQNDQGPLPEARLSPPFLLCSEGSNQFYAATAYGIGDGNHGYDFYGNNIAQDGQNGQSGVDDDEKDGKTTNPHGFVTLYDPLDVQQNSLSKLVQSQNTAQGSFDKGIPSHPAMKFQQQSIVLNSVDFAQSFTDNLKKSHLSDHFSQNSPNSSISSIISSQLAPLLSSPLEQPIYFPYLFLQLQQFRPRFKASESSYANSTNGGDDASINAQAHRWNQLLFNFVSTFSKYLPRRLIAIAEASINIQSNNSHNNFGNGNFHDNIDNNFNTDNNNNFNNNNNPIPPSLGPLWNPSQVESIRSALRPGLTLVKGPAGCGKTATLVQIVSELIYNYPSQRILILTQSNAGVDEILLRILRDTGVDSRYILRLGHRHEDLAKKHQNDLKAMVRTKLKNDPKNQQNQQNDRNNATFDQFNNDLVDFSAYGRSNYLSQHTQELLGLVGLLNQSIDMGQRMDLANYIGQKQITAALLAQKQQPGVGLGANNGDSSNFGEKDNSTNMSNMHINVNNFANNAHMGPNLEQIALLSATASTSFASTDTCYSSLHFYSKVVQPLWQSYLEKLNVSEDEISAYGGSNSGQQNHPKNNQNHNDNNLQNNGINTLSKEDKIQHILHFKLVSLFPFKAFFAAVGGFSDYNNNDNNFNNNNGDNNNNNNYMNNNNNNNNFIPQLLQPFTTTNFQCDLYLAQLFYTFISYLFLSIQELSPLLTIPSGGFGRGNFIQSQYSRVFGATVAHLIQQRAEISVSNGPGGEISSMTVGGLNYDTVLIEEAGQLLDLNTFLSTLSQQKQSSRHFLQRLVMIGDTKQLPPLVQHMDLIKLSNFGQSMFTRLLNLGARYIMLNEQGRAHPSISKIWKWVYDKTVIQDGVGAIGADDVNGLLNNNTNNTDTTDQQNEKTKTTAGDNNEDAVGMTAAPLTIMQSSKSLHTKTTIATHSLIDLPQTLSFPSYINGLVFNAQAVIMTESREERVLNTGIQNSYEADYVCCTYIYLLLQNYSLDDIAIIVAYREQLNLINSKLMVMLHKFRRILHQVRGADIFTTLPGTNPHNNPNNPLEPSLLVTPRVATIDQFQGQQADIILLSMVRTESPGYLRDSRRLLVAFSRARLGCYVFLHQNLLQLCPQLQPFLVHMARRPGLDLCAMQEEISEEILQMQQQQQFSSDQQLQQQPSSDQQPLLPPPPQQQQPSSDQQLQQPSSDQQLQQPSSDQQLQQQPSSDQQPLLPPPPQQQPINFIDNGYVKIRPWENLMLISTLDEFQALLARVQANE